MDRTKGDRDLDAEVAKIVGCNETPLPRFSLDPGDALRALDYFHATQHRVVIEGDAWYDGAEWWCRIFSPVPEDLRPEGKKGPLGEGKDIVTTDESQEDPSFPLAICRAIVDYGKRKR